MVFNKAVASYKIRTYLSCIRTFYCGTYAKTFSFHPCRSLQPYTLDVSLGIFFSADVDTLNNPSSPFLHYMQEVNKYNYLNLWRILCRTSHILLQTE